MKDIKFISEFAKNLENEVSAVLGSVDKEKSKIEAEKARLSKREADIELKEKEQKEYDLKLNARHEEVCRLETKFKKVVDLTEWEAKLIVREKEMEKKIKFVEDQLAEVSFKEAQVKKSELALSDREQSYKEKIQKEVVDRFFKAGLSL